LHVSALINKSYGVTHDSKLKVNELKLKVSHIVDSFLHVSALINKSYGVTHDSKLKVNEPKLKVNRNYVGVFKGQSELRRGFICQHVISTFKA
jgi:hypothetical protein